MNPSAWRPGFVAIGLTGGAILLAASPVRAAGGDVLPYAVSIAAGALAGTSTGRKSAILGAAVGALLGASAHLAFTGWTPGEPLTPTPLAFLLHRLGAATTALPRAMMGLAVIAAVGAAIGVAWRSRRAIPRLNQSDSTSL